MRVEGGSGAGIEGTDMDSVGEEVGVATREAGSDRRSLEMMYEVL